ncbi:hypothetical protein [uncultured Flavobacterium sp.]|uniref:hypothetical protein n=1 Tax=uncultured Flavobacterium sp. TaxID=165435 RepID=UPI0025E6D09C|nr:hypothetical protein [uncultured Flavobacterium sp.]
MTPNEFLRFIAAIEKDDRLTAWHLSLLAAILFLALRQGRKEAVKVSRSRIMRLAHITTLPTYHKYFKSLQQLGYIVYRPSYHPGVRSELDIKNQPCK